MKTKFFCEVMLNEILPAVRAIMANRLINFYGFTQSEVAKRLGLTQPAISQYKNGLRGKKIQKILYNKRIIRYLNSLCDEVISSNIDINLKICEICNEARESGAFKKEYTKKPLCIIEIFKVKAYG